MNASFPSESSRQVPTSQGALQGGRQTPSVPISVYRELATELKATQAMVESLNQQNQQLSQQNQMLRQEMLSFAESADRLRQAVGYSQPQTSPEVSGSHQFIQTNLEEGGDTFAYGLEMDLDSSAESGSPSGRLGEAVGVGVSNLANHLNRLVSPKPRPEAAGPSPDRKPKPKRVPAKKPQMLYTEERLEPSRPSSGGRPLRRFKRSMAGNNHSADCGQRFWSRFLNHEASTE